NSQTPSFTAPTLPVGTPPATLTFSLLVDNGTLSASDSTTVIVNSTVGVPAVTAGADQAVAAGATVTLTGGASDPNVPTRSLTYAWNQVVVPGVPVVSLVNPTRLTPTFNAPALG